MLGYPRSFDGYNNDNWIDITSAPHDEFAFTVEFREDGAFESSGYLGNGGGAYIATSTAITVHKDESVYAHYTFKELTYTDTYVIVVMNPMGKVTTPIPITIRNCT